ncbi:hypothetical protein SNE40_004961 [Patella caerulea]|uniref:Pre-mRNA-splicing factor 38 n=2 Tax=Patella caerulea TaxID=87958 RepID=A0AAN8PYT0_PATCE
MANRTVKDAHSVKGTNPQYLVEKIIRTRIYECRFWKEECFALTAALLVDKAMELKYIGGVFGGNVKPTDFLCLVLKMLQIQPEKDIVVEFIKNEDFKYVRVLGAVYMRLTGTSLDCYKYLEPLYLDYRTIRKMNRSGEFQTIHMDEFIDELLREERVIDIILPRLQKRIVLEDSNELEQRVSPLEEDLEEMDISEDEEAHRSPSPEKHRGKYKDLDKPSNRSPSPKYKRSRSRSPHRRDRHKRKSRSRSRDRHRDKRHRSPGRRHKDDDDRHRKSKKSKRDRHHRDEDRHKDRGDKHRGDKRDKDRSRHKDRHRDHGSKDSQEIHEANETRAKLGLPPLK